MREYHLGIDRGRETAAGTLDHAKAWGYLRTLRKKHTAPLRPVEKIFALLLEYLPVVLPCFQQLSQYHLPCPRNAEDYSFGEAGVWQQSTDMFRS